MFTGCPNTGNVTNFHSEYYQEHYSKYSATFSVFVDSPNTYHEVLAIDWDCDSFYQELAAAIQPSELPNFECKKNTLNNFKAYILSFCGMRDGTQDLVRIYLCDINGVIQCALFVLFLL